jgi:transglutaminase-like putative cysteine protease
MSSPTRPSLQRDVVATLLVAAFSMAVVVGFCRVFIGWPFLADMALVVAAGHGAGLLLRRLRVAAWIAVPAMVAVLAWTVLAVFYADTFSWAMPTSETWEMMRTHLTSVREEFRTAVAPVEYGLGWDVLASIGVATAVLLADVFAFRADARAETLVPGGVLFVFVGALGDDRLRIASTVVLVGVGVLTTAGLRWYHSEPGRAEVASPWRRWPVAVAFGVVVALAAGFVGPRLPGADAAPLYDTSGRGGGVAQVVSPLVDIRSRLTNRTTTELFRVRADVESYWRVSALPEFDGTIWGLPERDLEPVDTGAGAPAGSLVLNRQQFTIGALGGTLVPAAPDAVQASPPDVLRFAAETSTLVRIDRDLEAGDVIDIVSASPTLDAEILSGATSNDPGDAIYTSVPVDLPEVVGVTARRLTSAARSNYEAAIFVQAWFQREFEYSLDVRRGHGNSAIESFLTDRVGYCEQFAGTYAAMMRTLGIPARVAVGFTSGVAVGEGEYSVLGRNAHAWPEVWFDDIGWVGFEPTPGRGAPNAENYTRLPPRQDTTATASDIDVGTTPQPAAPSSPIDGGLNIPEFEVTPPSGGTADATTEPIEATDEGVPWPALAVLVILAGIIGAPALVRFLRTRQPSQSVDLQVADAWHRATDAMAVVGVPMHPSDTPLEVAASTRRHFPLVARPMTSLAEVVTAATYGADGTVGFDAVGAYGASTVHDCRNWAKQIDRVAMESLDWQQRTRRYFTTWR